MQVGSFYEIYVVDFIDKNNKHIIRGPNLKEFRKFIRYIYCSFIC